MSGQDVNLLIPAGDSRTVQMPGEFIYLKSCAGQVSVILDGKRVEMEAGDKIRVERFTEFLVENRSAADQKVSFVVGFGDYWRQIVQGEIKVNTGIQGKFGWRADARRTLKGVLMPEVISATPVQRGQVSRWQEWINMPGGYAMNTYRNPFGNWMPLPAPSRSAVALPISAWSENNGSYIGVVCAFFDPALRSTETTAVIPRSEYNDVGMDVVAMGWDDESQLFVILVGNGNPVKMQLRAYDTAANLVWKSDIVNAPPAWGALFRYRDNYYVSDYRNLYLVGSADGHAIAPKKLYETPVNVYGRLIDESMRFIRFGGSGLSGSYVYDLESGQAAFDGDVSVPILNPGGGGFEAGNFIYMMDTTGHGGVPMRTLMKMWRYDADSVQAVSVIRDDQSVTDALMMREPVYTTADVTAAVDGSGRVVVRGEVIRATLEAYYGQQVSGDYLDAVTRFSAGTLALTGGTQTLDAAQVADSGAIRLPTRFEIDHDATLQLAGELGVK